jgi:hypothetical protein
MQQIIDAAAQYGLEISRKNIHRHGSDQSGFSAQEDAQECADQYDHLCRKHVSLASQGWCNNTILRHLGEKANALLAPCDTRQRKVLPTLFRSGRLQTDKSLWIRVHFLWYNVLTV